MLLTPATSYRTSDFLDAARKLQVEVVIGTNQNLIAAGFTQGHIVRVDFRDCDSAVRSIVAESGRQDLSAVVGVDESTAQVAAAAAKALGLVHNDVEAIGNCHDKFAFRQALEKIDLLSHEFQLVPFAELEIAAGRVKYPCVLKPLSLSGSRGVIRADSPTGFVAAGQRIQRLLATVDGLPDAHRDAILCEKFIPGREVALEGILRDGQLTVLALFDKPDPLDGPFFEETIYVTPSTLGQTVQTAVVNTVDAACRSLGLCTGPIHAELRINDQGAWLIELAARSIGGRCSQSLRFAGDTNLEEIILRCALDDEMPVPEREPHASGVMMLPIRRGGRVRKVTGADRAAEVPGISSVLIEIRRGEQLVPLPEGDRYLGFIFARGARPANVERALRAAEARITVELTN